MATAAKAVEAADPRFDQALTFSTLPEWYVVGALCCKCHRTGWLDRYDLARRFGKRASLVNLSPRLRCVVCNQKPGNKFVIARMKR